MDNSIRSLVEYTNFISAFKKVAAGGGAPGTDHITADQFGYNLENNIQILIEEIKTSAYTTRPVAKFQHKNRLSEKVRVFGIPSVRDRVVQVALLNILEPVFEKRFLRCSYGYRPRKSAMQAVIKAEKLCGDKILSYAFNADIHSFFDSIDTALLLEKIKAVINEKPLLNLLSIIIRSSSEDKPKGITLGAPTSPLFGNIYLNDLDKMLFKEANAKYLRYADDFVLFAETRDKAEDLRIMAVNFLENELMLSLSADKSFLADIDESGFDFLGYHFNKNGKYPSKKALDSFSEKITNLTVSGVKNIYLDSIIDGWLNYFDIKILDKNNYARLLEKIDGLLVEKPDFNVGLSILKSALMAKNFHKDISSFIIKSIKEKILSNEVSKEYPRDIKLDAAILSGELDMGKDLFDFIEGREPTGIDNPNNREKMDIESGERILNACDYFDSKGDYEKSVRLLSRFLEKNGGFTAGYRKLSQIYKKLGLTGMARKMEDFYESENPDGVVEDQNADAITNADINQDIASAFLQLFGGFANAYSEADLDSAGRIRYSKVDKPLDEEVIRSHINGLKTIGGYILRPDNAITYAVIDIDISSGYIKNMPIISNDYSDFLKEALDYALIIQKSVKDETGFECYVEFSGYKGYHVWFFFEKPIQAKIGRDFANHFINLHKVRPHLNVEIFPKENKLGGTSPGSLIKLPLGVNISTGNETYFIDDAGIKIINQFGFIMGNIDKISYEKIKIVASYNGAIGSDSGNNQLGAVVLQLNENEKMVLKVLLEKCSVMRYLYDKVKITKYLTHTERLGILYSIGYAYNGKAIVHHIMQQCSNYNRYITQKYINKIRGNQYQISCNKLREWLSYITSQVNCNCKFKLAKGEYPNMLLHIRDTGKTAVENDIKQVADTKIDELKKVDIADTFHEFLNKKQEFFIAEAALNDIEKEIEKIFNDLKSDSIETPWGICRKVGEYGKKKFILEL